MSEFEKKAPPGRGAGEDFLRYLPPLAGEAASPKAMPEGGECAAARPGRPPQSRCA